MANADDTKAIRKRFRLLSKSLNERTRRLFAAAEARVLGRGGIAAAAQATGLGRETIVRGLADLEAKPALSPARVRRPGGGRKRATALDPTLAARLERLVDPVTRGDPESPLLWTSKSTRKLAAELSCEGRPVSHRVVAEILHDLGYSLQANRKTTEGLGHPDRNAQFEYIARRVRLQLEQGEPAISVDTKKKELVGDFKNAGREWRPKGAPEEVRVHDFLDPELGKAIPYGVYDVGQNEGWVSVGTDHDTAAFAVATLQQWWQQLGAPTYPGATDLLITADGGGSNGSRCRLWKVALQRFADETGLRISVCHFPPGTSKWNKIEHRLFSHITQNWRGRPLVSHEVVVNLIENTTTRAGLRVHAALDTTPYPTKQHVSDDQLSDLYLTHDPFHGEWNYSITPRQKLIP